VTYSIVARDGTTGELGVAVQSCFPSVGAAVSWAEPGVGAVATQAISEMSFGPIGLDLLRAGRGASEVVASLVALDGGAALRQLGVVAADGTAAAHTGSMCVPEAGHEVGDGFAVAANMMTYESVWPAMAAAFADTDGDLAGRLLATLDAAQGEGGDLRGMQAAALVVVAAGRHPPGQGRRIDVRVDDHPEPLVELRRLVALAEPYAQLDRAIELVGALDLEGARAAARGAVELRPGLLDAALIVIALTAMLDGVDAARAWVADWGGDRARAALLWRRMIASGLVPGDPGVVDATLA